MEEERQHKVLENGKWENGKVVYSQEIIKPDDDKKQN